jgi:hypothetical protein
MKITLRRAKALQTTMLETINDMPLNNNVSINFEKHIMKFVT